MDPQLLTALVALVSPIMALVGVSVGQRMQRRTTREQLAEQRRRDEMAWAREDQHRFAAEKRVIYADYLAACLRLMDLIGNIVGSVRRELETESEHAPPDFDHIDAHHRILRDGDYKTAVELAETEVTNVLTQLELIAPEAVREAALDLRTEFVRFAYFTVRGWNEELALKYLDVALDKQGVLEQAMRADLVVDKRSEVDSPGD